MKPFPKHHTPWRARLHEVIYEADTVPGKFFDILLIFFIITSVVVILLDSVASINLEYGKLLYSLEWFFTILFSIEYILRILAVKHPFKYIFSFFGLIDLISILPTYISLLFPGMNVLMVIRVMRLLRIFRVLKLVQYLGEAQVLIRALKASQKKITIFLTFIFISAVILGSLMYLIEGERNGFTSIPKGIYWAIVTMTTVGYGDISPQTALGQTIASCMMIMGYAILAVPTGIVTMELSQSSLKPISTQACPACSLEGHDHDAEYCKYCGEKM